MVEIRNKMSALALFDTRSCISSRVSQTKEFISTSSSPSSRQIAFFRDSFSVEMAQTTPDLNSLTTPEKCVADFCLIPVTPPESPGGVRPANQGHRPILADRHAHGISVAPDRRCAAADAAKCAEILDAFCGHDGRYDAYL